MRFFPLMIAIIISFSSFTVQNIPNHTLAPPTSPFAVSNKVPLPTDRIIKMKIKEVEKVLGRKLTLIEKIAFKITQAKLNKELKAKENGKSSAGKTAFTQSLISLCLLIVPFGIIIYNLAQRVKHVASFAIHVS